MLRDLLEKLVHQEWRDLKVSLVILVRRDNVDSKDLQDPKVARDSQVCLDLLVCKDLM